MSLKANTLIVQSTSRVVLAWIDHERKPATVLKKSGLDAGLRVKQARVRYTSNTHFWPSLIDRNMRSCKASHDISDNDKQ